VQAKVSGTNFKLNSACVLADLALLGNAQTVMYPGCTLKSSPPSAALGAFVVTQIRKDSDVVRARCLFRCARCLTRHQLQSAGHDAVVEVSLGSACIISVFPSEDLLRPKGKKELSTTDRLKWFVRDCAGGRCLNVTQGQV
jgi:hypothetical protein